MGNKLSPESKKIFQEAKENYDNNLFEKCINKLEQILLSNEKSSELYYLYGLALKKKSNFKEALAKFDKSLEMNRKDERVIGEIAFIEYIQSHIERFETCLEDKSFRKDKESVKLVAKYFFKLKDYNKANQIFNLISYEDLDKESKIEYIISQSESLYLESRIREALDAFLNEIDFSDLKNSSQKTTISNYFLIYLKLTFEVLDKEKAKQILEDSKNILGEDSDEYISLLIFYNYKLKNYNYVIDEANSFFIKKDGIFSMNKPTFDRPLNDSEILIFIYLSLTFAELNKLGLFENYLKECNYLTKIKSPDILLRFAKFYLIFKKDYKFAIYFQKLNAIAPKYIPGILFSIGYYSKIGKHAKANELWKKYSFELEEFKNDYNNPEYISEYERIENELKDYSSSKGKEDNESKSESVGSMNTDAFTRNINFNES